ncbi:GNAT family N-acetyltransferase [Aspergillus puulaauensis]|uniref:N-acetyltransferase domain-containing protein n=1 Tax=Aspergillus puulaauensis TaxID=1220207 RepID=A0A7R7XG52_9EURO|nr:uncharacterized protein APUU_21257S [Aspergillus puulaauensis]BCS20825.1 hypothetical protein APUU_21257S [Aspergillus puulaauensis]
MTISLRPAVPADAATLAEINIKAFTGQGFITNTFPGVPHAVIHELKVARYLKKIAHPQTHVIVAEDDASGALVGCARWIFPAAADGNAEGNVKGAGDLVDEDSAEAARGAEDALPEGTNRGIYTGFFEILKEKGKDYLRDDDVVLEFIATLPQHQRQGIGKALLRWGIERAEAENRRIYLEATTEGLPAYENSGWRALEQVHIDYARWGGQGTQTLTLMLRDP